MFSMSANDITKDSIDTYFSQLAKELKKEFGRNANIELVVVGGAAVMLNYDFREATKDIDALIAARSSIKDAVNRIGDKFGLQNGWINSDFRNTKSYSPQLIQYSKYYRTYNQVLTVRTIDAEYLIAMKLASFREYKNDRSDVAGILSSEKGKEINFDRITQAVDKLYGGWENMPEGVSTFPVCRYSILLAASVETYSSSTPRSCAILLPKYTSYIVFDEPVVTSTIKVEILSVYQCKSVNGKKAYDDTCITELEVY